MATQDVINKSKFFQSINLINVPSETITKLSEEVVTIKKLNIGCGPNVFTNGWLNTDKEDLSQYLNYLKVASFAGMPPEQVELTKKIRTEGVEFKVSDFNNGLSEHADNSVDRIYGGQIVEHLSPLYQFPTLMKECYRVLKPGGIMRLTTPDLDLLIHGYLNNEMGKFEHDQPAWYKDMVPSSQLAMIMFGSGGKESWNNYSGHMFLYTKQSMQAALEKIGFKDIKSYAKAGESDDPIMYNEVVDCGMSHSFAVEVTK